MAENLVLSRIAPREDKLLYQQVQERVKAGVESGVFPPGSKLPPLKDLSKAFRVNHITIRRGLDLLEKEGIVAVQPGVGIFVCGPEQSRVMVSSTSSAGTRQLRFGIVCVDSVQSRVGQGEVRMHPTVLQWLKGVRDNFAANRVAVQVFPCHTLRPNDGQSDALNSAIAAGELDGLIIAKPLDKQDDQVLAAWNLPTVFVSCEPHDRRYPSVTTNRQYGLQLLVRHLRELGHERLAILHYRSNPEIYPRIRRESIQAARSNGFDTFSEHDLIVVENFQRSLTWEHCFACANQALDRDATAVVAADELLANHVLWAASQRGIAIPRDVSLASLYDMLPDSHALPLTTLSTCDAEQEAARIAADLLGQAIEGQNIEGQQIRIMPSFVAGQTTGPVRRP